MRRTSYLYRAALSMLGMCVLAGFAITALHARFPDAAWPDPLVPQLFAGTSLLLFFLLWQRPERLVGVMRVTAWLNLAILWLQTWFAIYFVMTSTGHLLTEVLPPVEILLIPMMLFSVVFLPWREGWKMAMAAWVGVAPPLLLFLFLHPAELQMIRGLHLIVGLGPMSLLITLMVPLFRGLEFEVKTLEGQRLKAERLAELDALTGLRNRGAGEAHLDAASADHACVSLILFDIDCFKGVNDALGHAVGDSVLKEVARRCAALIRGEDSLVRWGGEEFLVILHDTDAHTAQRIAETLRASCRGRPFDDVGTVTASFGVSTWHGDEPIRDTLQRADAAMYHAKQAGRDRVASAESAAHVNPAAVRQNHDRFA